MRHRIPARDRLATRQNSAVRRRPDVQALRSGQAVHYKDDRQESGRNDDTSRDVEYTDWDAVTQFAQDFMSSLYESETYR